MLLGPADASAVGSNDNFADAETVGPGLPTIVSGSNFNATSEVGEPAHGYGGPAASVWYRWTPATSAQVTVSTCSTDRFPRTVLGAYTGSSVAALTSVDYAYAEACGYPDGGAIVTFPATAGTTYEIAVDGSSDPRDQGLFTLRLDVLPDSDGDGIPDDLYDYYDMDQCPTVPGPIANVGCPWPDSDGDGVPDYEDKCPDDPGPLSNQGCAEPEHHARPETKLTRSKINQTKRSAKFTFVSSEPHTFFVCKIDKKKFQGCSSPQTYKNLTPGKHEFQVEATTDYGGDRSPAVKKFKIKK